MPDESVQLRFEENRERQQWDERTGEVPNTPYQHPNPTPKFIMELSDLDIIPFTTYRQKRDWLEEISDLQDDDDTPLSESFQMLEARIRNFNQVEDSNLDPLAVLEYVMDFISGDSQERKDKRSRRSRGRGRR